MEDLQTVINVINKKFGDGSIARLSDVKGMELERITTGSFALDFATGGGWVKGRVHELFGHFSAGKSYLFLRTIKENKGRSAYIDVEHALDPVFIEQMGIETKWMYISQPDNAEEALNILEILVKCKRFDLVVLDSIAALVPMIELETQMEDQQMGVKARLMNKIMRKLQSALQPENIMDEKTYNKTVVILSNQMREKIGVLYGSPETTPGGKGKDFTASLQIKLRKDKEILEDKKKIGHSVKFVIVKNRYATPYTSGEFDLYLSGEIDNLKAIVLKAIEFDLIKQAGAYYEYQNFKCQGKDKIVEHLKEKPEELEKLKITLLEMCKRIRYAPIPKLG